jgi:hypothetical protein
MSTFETTCHVCGASVIRKTQSAPVALHFCGMGCKAEHQRRAKPVTEAWLREHYLDKGMDSTQIAHIVHRDPKSVWNWLKDFGIPTRKRGMDVRQQFKKGHLSGFAGHRHSDSTRRRLSEISIAAGRVPYKPEIGSYMKGRKGSDTPQWKGGITPERQSFYSSSEWRSACVAVWKRADAKCERCGLDHRTLTANQRGSFHVHHIISFMVKELRAEVSNLSLLCARCHRFVHSKLNTTKEFLK